MDLKKYLIHFQTLSALEKKKELETVEVQNNLIYHMLIHIGSPDPQLRDELIYSTWCDLIGTIDCLTQQQLLHILNTVIDEQHVFYNIDHPANDSVFTRSFSILVIPLLLENHKRHPFLSKEQWDHLFDTVNRYLRLEQDGRGYVTDQGWAHAIAHGADALESLASCSPQYAQCIQMLHTIGQVISRYELYIHLEDERLAIAMATLLIHGKLQINDWIHWLNNVINWNMSSQYEREYLRITNIRNVLSSLYFRLDRTDIIHPDKEQWMESIKQHLHILIKPLF